MASTSQQVIGVGTSANDHTGDPLRTAMQKINANFGQVFTGNAYMTTMDTAANGTVNATALTADITAAAGKQIIIPPGSYSLNAVAMSSVTGGVNLKFLPGSTLVPYGAGGLYRSGIMLHFTNTNVVIEGLNVDGQGNGSAQAYRQDNGTLDMRRTTITGMGSTSVTSTIGVYGLLLKGLSDCRLDGITISNLNDARNGTYADAPGTIRYIFTYNAGHYHYTNIFITPGDQGTGDDNDFIQFLDDQGTVTMNGTMENVTIRYNGGQRRCIKFQGGYHFVDHADIRKDSTFTPVVNTTNVTGAADNGAGLIRIAVTDTTNIVTGNTVVVSGVTGTTEANSTWVVTTIDGTHLDLQGSTFVNAYVSGGTANTQTNTGENNLNCVDIASGITGFVRVTNSYIDATGFTAGLLNSGGANTYMYAKNVKLIGSRLNTVRFNLEHAINENSSPIGFYIASGDLGSGMEDCEIIGFVKGATPQGDYASFVNCKWDDQRDLWIEAVPAAQHKCLRLENNRVITRTPGSLGTTRCARIGNFINVIVKGNTLIEDGNITHANKFIDFTDANATGIAANNSCYTPGLATTAITIGASSVVNLSPTYTGTTGTGNAVLSASPTLTGTFLAASGTISGTLYINGGVIQEALYANGNSGTSMALAGNNGNLQSVTISGAVTFTYTTPTHPCRTTYIVTQDGSGHIYAMPVATKWIGGTIPSYSTAAGKVDIFTIIYDGTNYYGTSGIAFA